MNRWNANSPRVAVVGAGAAGVAVATHLAAGLPRDTRLQVEVFEPSRELGLGIAYGTDDDQHLLNVPAKGMSVYRDDMDHFRRWARVGADEFLPRRRYGRYLQWALEQAWRARSGRLRHVRRRVVDVIPGGDQWQLRDDAGGLHLADFVVLATGHQTPAHPGVLSHDVQVHSRAHWDPWSAQALAGLRPGEHVLCLGTGLTFVDVALTALAREDVVVTGVSRRGRLPARHLTPPSTPGAPMDLPADAVVPLDAVVDHVRAAGRDWRSAVDGLRGQTPQIWQRLTPQDRDRFMEYLSRDWDILRHRMAPAVAQSVDEHRTVGRLQVVAAPRYSVEVAGGRFLLRGEGCTIKADRLIVCTGPRSDVRLTPLGASIIRRGIGRPGPYAIGYDVDPLTGELIAADASVTENLFTVGPLRRGVLLESTAMPEISAQAQQVASSVAQRCLAVCAV